MDSHPYLRHWVVIPFSVLFYFDNRIGFLLFCSPLLQTNIKSSAGQKSVGREKTSAFLYLPMGFSCSLIPKCSHEVSEISLSITVFRETCSDLSRRIHLRRGEKFFVYRSELFQLLSLHVIIVLHFIVYFVLLWWPSCSYLHK